MKDQSSSNYYKKKIWVIGSAVLDIMARPMEPDGAWQEKQRIEEIRILPGGDAVNQSLHLASLGMKTELIACTGADDNGRLLCSALKDRNVGTTYVKKRRNLSTGTSLVLVGKEGQRHTFSVRGAHSDICRGDLPEEFPQDLTAVSLASIYSMPLLEKDGLREFLQSAREKGILIFADLASDKQGLGLEGIRPFLPLIDYFLPSQYDIEKMTGLSAPEEEAAVLQEAGCAHVIIKCGEKGCYAAGDGTAFGTPASDVCVRDTTGAGDCMSAAFVYRILAGDSLREACTYACAAGSCSTQYYGASAYTITDKEVRKFLVG